MGRECARLERYRGGRGVWRVESRGVRGRGGHRRLGDAEALPEGGDGGEGVAAGGGAAVELGGGVADAGVEVLDAAEGVVGHGAEELGLRVAPPPRPPPGGPADTPQRKDGRTSRKRYPCYTNQEWTLCYV